MYTWECAVKVQKSSDTAAAGKIKSVIQTFFKPIIPNRLSKSVLCQGHPDEEDPLGGGRCHCQIIASGPVPCFWSRP